MVPGFVPLILAGAVTVVMGVVVLFGLTRIFRQRKITMTDPLELPAPPSGTPGGPTQQA